MNQYIPPCGSDFCVSSASDSEASRKICQVIGDGIIRAGGAGLLEVTICPVKALFFVAPEQEDPLMSAIRKKLGIIGIGPSDLLD